MVGTDKSEEKHVRERAELYHTVYWGGGKYVNKKYSVENKKKLSKLTN